MSQISETSSQTSSPFMYKCRTECYMDIINAMTIFAHYGVKVMSSKVDAGVIIMNETNIPIPDCEWAFSTDKKWDIVVMRKMLEKSNKDLHVAEDTLEYYENYTGARRYGK